MPKEYKDKIEADGVEIAIISEGDNNDYISLTDIAKKRTIENPGYVIQNWMRNRSTVQFLGLWEKFHNPAFNYLEFEAIENEAGTNSFVLTPKRWIETTNSIGMRTKAGRYAATYAHKDIAFEFASWISPEFKLYIIKDYQRLKTDENSRLSLDWNLRRELAKTNYKIHTDAVKECLIPPDISAAQRGIKYATEADVINVALFGMSAKEWRDQNPDKAKRGNIRDEATLEQLIILTNLESYNAVMIKDGVSQSERLKRLNETAISQAKSLIDNPSLKKLKSTPKQLTE
ncbi:MAG: KilA-N domain-containing protein [Firmicutes bacterium]|nr:KilA-N domain-containing protein [Bacillota bacterium]